MLEGLCVVLTVLPNSSLLQFLSRSMNGDQRNLWQNYRNRCYTSCCTSCFVANSSLLQFLETTEISGEIIKSDKKNDTDEFDKKSNIYSGILHRIFQLIPVRSGVHFKPTYSAQVDSEDGQYTILQLSVCSATWPFNGSEAGGNLTLMHLVSTRIT